MVGMSGLDRIKRNIPNPQESDRVDPTTSSRVVLPSETLQDGGPNRKNNSTKMDETGARLHEVNQVPAMQQFVSRVLKPFFNVADIVEIEGKYYSHEPHLENITIQADEIEVEADIKLIDYLFNDSDREMRDPKVYEQHNLIRENDKHIFFDFQFGKFFWLDGFREDSFKGWYRGLRSDGQTFVLKKLERMLEYYHTHNGREQVEAAYKATGQNMEKLFKDVPKENTTFDDFYRELVRRVDVMHRIAFTISSDQEQKAA